MSTVAARQLAPMIFAARRRPRNTTVMDWAVGAIRRDLVATDEEFFRQAASRFREWGAIGIERGLYPPLMGRGFSEAMTTGWRSSQRRLDGMLRAWSKHVRREARVRGADHLTNLVLRAENIIVPEEAIARYVATRIPPLKHDIEALRRRLCRDIVADAAREGLGVRPTMERLKRDGFGRSTWHRETIARTEGAHLYNHGQVARNRASGAVKGYQFVAIMDDRTTEECEALHGRSFKADEIDGVTPPLHYSCRSELVPILFDEDPSWTRASEVKDWPEERQPMRGFGKIDLTQMPTREADAGDFLYPLRASEHEDVRAVVALLDRKLEGMD